MGDKQIQNVSMNAVRESNSHVLVLDCTQGARKDSFAKGVIACLKERDRFLALIEKYLNQDTNEHDADEDFSHETNGCESRKGCEAHGARDHDHGRYSLADVHTRIKSLSLGPVVEHDTYGVYAILAAAEAEAHGVSLEEVHFHEVGNAEATLWIAVSCLVMRQLMVERNVAEVVATPVCTGYGYVDCAHGRLPIPTPATANILEDVPTFAGDVEGELTTPTGAALVVYFAQRFLEPDKGEELRDATFLSAPRMSGTADGSELIVCVGGI